MVELEVEKDFVCRKGPVIMPAQKVLEPSHQKKWKNTLFGKLHITEPKSVKPYHVYRDISTWTDGFCKSKFTTMDLGDGTFSFHFEDEKDMKVVMDWRPWLVTADNGNEYLLLLTEWCPDTPPSKIMFSPFYPFWFQVHDIPYEYVSKEMGKKIGEATGHVVLNVQFDKGLCTTKNFLRVRVLVDVTKKLATGCWLAIDKNQPKKLLWVSFRYEELPRICYRCGIIGHSESSCLDDFEGDDALSYNPEGVGCESGLPAVLVEGQVLRAEGEKEYGPWLHNDEDIDDDDEEESECNDKDYEGLILRLADKWGFTDSD